MLATVARAAPADDLAVPKSLTSPTSLVWSAGIGSTAAAAISAANSLTLYRRPAESFRELIAPGFARSRSVAVMVPSIMSPDTTTKPMPAASRIGIISRRASSPARLLSATGRYSGIVGVEWMKWAW
jgi:hypothetical protein